MTYRKLPYIEL